MPSLAAKQSPAAGQLLFTNTDPPGPAGDTPVTLRAEPQTPAGPDGRNALKDSLNPRLESAAAVPPPQPVALRSLLSTGQREAGDTAGQLARVTVLG